MLIVSFIKKVILIMNLGVQQFLGREEELIFEYAKTYSFVTKIM